MSHFNVNHCEKCDVAAGPPLRWDGLVATAVAAAVAAAAATAVATAVATNC